MSWWRLATRWDSLDPGGESCGTFQSGVDVIMKAPVEDSVYQAVALDGRENRGVLLAYTSVELGRFGGRWRAGRGRQKLWTPHLVSEELETWAPYKGGHVNGGSEAWRLQILTSDINERGLLG